MNTSDQEDQIPIDFGAVYEFVDVAGIHGLRWHQWSRADAITSWRNKSHSREIEQLFSVNKSLHLHDKITVCLSL